MTPAQRAAAERLADVLDRCGGINAETEAAALLRELLAEPQREPVENRAWTILLTGPVHGLVGQHGETFPYSPAHYARVNVYAHPPQRQPLTEDQVWADDGIMSANAGAQLLMPCLMELVRAVERKHRIWEAP